MFKQGGASVQIYAPPLRSRDGAFAGVAILLIYIYLSSNTDGRVLSSENIVNFFTKCTTLNTSFTIMAVVILHPQNHHHESVMGGRIFEHSLPPV